MTLRRLIQFADPMAIVAVHRRMAFRAAAVCAPGFKATQRANIFVHGAPKSAIRFGACTLIDGTVEIYRNGRLTVGRNFFLGRSRIYCAHEVQIGDFVLISDNVTVMDSDLHPVSATHRRRVAQVWAGGQFPDVYEEVPGAPVYIDDDVWIGFGVSILKGVHVGQGAIVGAGSLVNRDVPPWTIVAGNPARVIRELKDDER